MIVQERRMKNIPTVKLKKFTSLPISLPKAASPTTAPYKLTKIPWTHLYFEYLDDEAFLFVEFQMKGLPPKILKYFNW